MLLLFFISFLPDATVTQYNRASILRQIYEEPNLWYQLSTSVQPQWHSATAISFSTFFFLCCFLAAKACIMLWVGSGGKARSHPCTLYSLELVHLRLFTKFINYLIVFFFSK